MKDQHKPMLGQQQQHHQQGPLPQQQEERWLQEQEQSVHNHKDKLQCLDHDHSQSHIQMEVGELHEQQQQ